MTDFTTPEYGSKTDEELVALAKESDGVASDELYHRYKNIVRGKARPYFLVGADRDDLIQEGMIGLFKAVRDYDCGRDAAFSTFAELCISRQMYSAIKALNRKKHAPLNSYISIYASREDSAEGMETPLEEMLEANPNDVPEKYVIDKENLQDLEEEIDRELSDLERQVLDLYITGMSVREISAVLGRDEKSTDNAMQRIRNKLKKYLK
ncbi:MAG: RNA polymerase sporulation sigma factor SigH [Clostridia bacterium]|nr:RNA polymerase sporulation sigma factor SigH [Clostridia bacterium]